jgi:hypothetical protein
MLFVGVREVAVPGEEGAREVDVHGLLEMDGDEVIEEGLRARSGRAEEAGLCLKAFDGGDVGFAIGFGEGAPGAC